MDRACAATCVLAVSRTHVGSLRAFPHGPPPRWTLRVEPPRFVSGTSTTAGRSSPAVAQCGAADRGPGGGREGAQYVVAVFEAQHQDSGFREFEADTAESVLDVVG